ncbi:unnamed protein product [Amoebophrya sp. A25]|nr:unnamed protein product [Amoebophrya sp. A25]|eukprot:GSA25T00021160001.1
MMAAILTKRASIPEECKMSEHAKDFVLKILEPDVAKRPTPLIALQHPWFSATEEVEISPAVLEAAGVESSKREVASDIEAERDENFNEQMQNRRTSRMSVVGRLSIRQSVSTQPGGGLGRASVSSTKAGLNPLFGDNMAESGRRSVGSRVAESFAVRRSFLKGPPEQPAAPPAIRKSKFHDTALNYAAMQFRKSNSIAMCGDVVQNFANGLDATTATLLTSSDGKGSPLRGRAVSVNNAMLPSALNEASRRKLPNIEMLQFSPERANNLHEKYEKGDREWTSSGGDKNNKGTS